MKKNITKCPICNSQNLFIEKIRCQECNTAIEGRFNLISNNELNKLNDDLSHFLKVFIFAEGNIKQVERLMNCSYPKVKNLLKKLKAALDLESDSYQNTENNNDILQKVESGELNVEEAIKLLQ